MISAKVTSRSGPNSERRLFAADRVCICARVARTLLIILAVVFNRVQSTDGVIRDARTLGLGLVLTRTVAPLTSRVWASFLGNERCARLTEAKPSSKLIVGITV